MADRGDPSALRWLVGGELTRYRTVAGKTTTAAGKHLGCTPGKITHLEHGIRQQQPADVTKLLRFYGADQADIDRLASLAGSADQRTWWAPWTDVVPDWLRTFVGLEGLASTVADYSTGVVPALLQTEHYALGVTSGNVRVRPDHFERTVALRMERQHRLLVEDDPVRLVALIEASVLDRPIGDTATMRAQFEHLINVSEKDNITVAVLPTHIGSHEGLAGPFTLLEFAAAQPITYVELINGAVYVQDQDQVRGYNRLVGQLLDVALSPADTLKAIRTRLENL